MNTYRGLHKRLFGAITVGAALWIQAQPIQLHPDNPRYFLWRGNPTALITSAERYGAILNSAFDFESYLETLERDGMNYTRVFSGAYVEPQGAFQIARNTLAPEKGAFLAPWSRSDVEGYAGGGAKFDLEQWNAAYFQRLHAFMTRAEERGVVVEFTLFCPMYEEAQWALSPLNARNNVNNVGAVDRESVFTLTGEPRLLETQWAFTEKVVRELNGYDNLLFEICNEPYFGGVTMEWQTRIAETIVAIEAELPQRHLIAQNIAHQSALIEAAHPAVAIFNFHYATPPEAMALNASVRGVFGDDETGFRGQQDQTYRTEAWEFMFAGGGLFNHLDYSFAAGYERGAFAYPPEQPGGGSAALRRQLAFLSATFHSLDFIHMEPDIAAIVSGLPAGAHVYGLAHPETQLALYFRVEGSEPPAATASETPPTPLTLRLSSGLWEYYWVDPLLCRTTETGVVLGSETTRVPFPAFSHDAALILTRRQPEP